jgi:predicted SAM-dependent methyltransferase
MHTHDSHPATSAEDPLSGLIRAPEGMLPRWRHYSQRYGAIHAALSFVGRQAPWFWHLVGRSVTRPYLKKWLARPGFKALNLGGGFVLSDKWLTADMDVRSDVFMNVNEPLPLPDGVVDVVFSEEVIEHISKSQGEAMLKECLRILKPGGWLRLTTPSLDYFARRALSVPEGTSEINDIFHLHDHRHIYSEQELHETLKSVGFMDVTPSSYRAPGSRYGHFDSHPARFAFAPAEWSQYWEARKPDSQ